MSKKIMEAMEYMDQKYIDEAVGAAPQKCSYKPVIRWAAVAACLVLVASLGFGYFGGWFAAPQEQIILTPTRYGLYQGANRLNESYTLQEGFEKADVVAWIRIGNWLGENTENHPLGKTYFAAEVIECYKGNLPDTFCVKQYGSSKGTSKAFPLLTHGNELLLFLKVSEDKGYGNCYYIMGSYGTVIDVVKDSNGVAYAITGIPIMGASIEKDVKNLARDAALKSMLCKTAKEYDEILCDRIAASQYLFALEDIEFLFK